MGTGEPVPVEDDIPNLIIRDDTIVKFRHNIKYGNWRWHAENVHAGHAPMIHKNSVRVWFHRSAPMGLPLPPRVTQAVDGLGVDVGAMPSRRKSTQEAARRQAAMPRHMRAEMEMKNM